MAETIAFGTGKRPYEVEADDEIPEPRVAYFCKPIFGSYHTLLLDGYCENEKDKEKEMER